MRMSQEYCDAIAFYGPPRQPTPEEIQQTIDEIFIDEILGPLFGYSNKAKNPQNGLTIEELRSSTF